MLYSVSYVVRLRCRSGLPPPISRRLSMKVHRELGERLSTSNELSLERLGRNCSPLYPWLQPYGRIGIACHVRDLPGHSRARRLIQAACDALTSRDAHLPCQSSSSGHSQGSVTGRSKRSAHGRANHSGRLLSAVRGPGNQRV